MAIVAVLAGAVALALRLAPTGAHNAGAGASQAASAPISVPTVTAAATEPTIPPETEVPNVVGKQVKVAETVLSAAGFKVQTREASTAPAAFAADAVVTQQPGAGARLAEGQTVVVTYKAGVQTSSSASAGKYVVVIDAGHQAKANLALEPEGPGSSVKKPKVAGGATGVATHIPEYVDALAISLKLQKLLEAQGVKVVMVRTGNSVNIPNSERAAIGNRAHANLVVRVHLNSATSSSVRGILTLYPNSKWTTSIEGPSKSAAGLVESAVTQATGAKVLPLRGASDMTGFNFSKVPTIIVECGFMSNPTDDRLGAQPAYQQKIAQGIGNGVMAFLKSR